MGWMLRNCPKIAHLSYCVILSRLFAVLLLHWRIQDFSDGDARPEWGEGGGGREGKSEGLADTNLFLNKKAFQ